MIHPELLERIKEMSKKYMSALLARRLGTQFNQYDIEDAFESGFLCGFLEKEYFWENKS